MKVSRTHHGYGLIEYPRYAENFEMLRLVQESSAAGESPFGPGSSYLWVGDKHHLDRQEVLELVAHLHAWLETGSLILGGNAATHTLYTDADPDKPASILDGNREVVLGLCKVCGAAERELDERPCNPPKPAKAKK